MENVNLSKVIKVGDSLAVVIPVAILRGLKINRGDRVVFGVYDDNTFAVRRVPPQELRDLKPTEVKF
jgi:antitoxin component of MazEF toxin-antitoxin module